MEDDFTSHVSAFEMLTGARSESPARAAPHPPSAAPPGVIARIIEKSKFLSPGELKQLASFVIYTEGIDAQVAEVKKAGHKYAIVGPVAGYDLGLGIDLTKVGADTLRQIDEFIAARQG